MNVHDSTATEVRQDCRGYRSERLYSALSDRYELAEHEDELLRQACAVLDTVEALEDLVAVDGLTVEGNGGVPKVHPALVELRQQRTTFARLIVALRIPLDDDEGRTQARPVRGVYGIA